MLFNSLHFLFFFVAIFFAYYCLVPGRFRWVLLLVGSCYFYMAYIPSFILVLFGLILIDYTLARQIAMASGRKRKVLFAVSIVANLGTLFFFKYFNFFNENVALLAQAINWNYSVGILRIALPLGLSFHIFQSLSYVIEVYRGKQQPEKNLGVYGLYVMFFPQLVAGPIERPQHLLHQFHRIHSFDPALVRRGLEIMLWGFFKKMVIADSIAVLVDHVYGNLSTVNGLSVLIAALLFSYQIYCDFSGYSDIAVGSAMVFGYDLTNNFDRPFSSRSVAEFWRRWHISLSSWLRDYLYYPLAFAGKRVSKSRLFASLIVTFTLIGLWHGANWTYVVFGLLQGIYIAFSLLTVNARKRIAGTVGLIKCQGLYKVWQIVLVFLLFSFSSIFFRADSLDQTFRILEKISSAPAYLGNFFWNWRGVFSSEELGIGLKSAAIVFFGICFMEVVQYYQAKYSTRHIFEGRGRLVRWSWYYLLIFGILCFGYLGAQTFIYFKF